MDKGLFYICIAAGIMFIIGMTVAEQIKFQQCDKSSCPGEMQPQIIDNKCLCVIRAK